VTLRPAIFDRHVAAFDSLRPWRNAAANGPYPLGVSLLRNPITGIAGCCPRAASGHVAAAPPSAANNSRRPMLTVIRPSPARCVEGTIARHERAVFTFKESRNAAGVAGTLPAA